ncbi:MAG: hypothetical protein HZA91_19130, partial [Verrucomicrobia bacterium]|nr:hypothetical protein [Verrucomicrobiota bacterium]
MNKRIFLLTPAVAFSLLAASPLRAQQADPYAQLPAYDFNQPRATLAAIEDEARAADAAKRAVIEKKLLAALANPQATYAAKQFVCRMLREIGSDACVAPAAALLTDEKLSHMARFALQGNPSPKVDAAFRDALPKVKGALVIGVMDSIGRRGDAKAVPALAKLAAGSGADTARAALLALGQIGNADARAALAKLQPAEPLRATWADAYLKCADRAVAAKKTADALAIYRKIYDGNYATASRVAALTGLAMNDPATAAELLKLVQGSDPKFQQAAAHLLSRVPRAAATQTFAAALPSLPPAAQAVVVTSLGVRADAAAGPAVAKLADSSDADVKLAALTALASLGDASNVPALVRAAVAGGPAGDAAKATLGSLHDAKVNAALLAILKGNETPCRVLALESLTARSATSQVAAILDAARDADADVRKAAFKSLRSLAGPNELKPLLAMLAAAKPAEQDPILDALSSAVSRATDKQAAASVIVAGLSSESAKPQLFAVLAKLGGDKALETVRADLKSGDLDTRKAAIRALGSWSDAAPMEALLGVATGDSDTACRILALRGYIQLIGQADKAVDPVKLYQNALKAASRPEEKTL